MGKTNVSSVRKISLPPASILDWKLYLFLQNSSCLNGDAFRSRSFPTMNYGAGENKDGLFVYGARGAERDISKMKSEEDWRYLLKNMLINIQSATPTLSDVRSESTSPRKPKSEIQATKPHSLPPSNHHPCIVH